MPLETNIMDATTMTQKSKILVIEDELAIRENIVELLEIEGYEVLSAENGQLGLKLATSQLPNLIVCDVMMPQMDGYQVIERLQKNPVTKTIPFIFLTALSGEIKAIQGLSLGADSYLEKPCKPDILLATIENRLNKYSAYQEEVKNKFQNVQESLSYFIPHELRTPLNGILGFSSLVLDDLATEKNHPDIPLARQKALQEIFEMVELIQTSARRLEKVTQNVLLYKDLIQTAGDPESVAQMRSHSTNPEIIVYLGKEVANKANRASDLEMEIPETRIQISQNRLAKLAEELIDNALKFSEPGTPVQISGNVDKEKFYLTVTNLGRGMTAEQIAEIGAYRQFERKMYEQQGCGLGLIIVKQIVEIHDGELLIQSDRGKQTTVRVALPVAAH